jgi:hypothetical protein
MAPMAAFPFVTVIRTVLCQRYRADCVLAAFTSAAVATLTTSCIITTTAPISNTNGCIFLTRADRVTDTILCARRKKCHTPTQHHIGPTATEVL